MCPQSHFLCTVSDYADGLSARKQQVQCTGTGVTAVLHQTIDITAKQGLGQWVKTLHMQDLLSLAEILCIWPKTLYSKLTLLSHVTCPCACIKPCTWTTLPRTTRPSENIDFPHLLSWLGTFGAMFDRPGMGSLCWTWKVWHNSAAGEYTHSGQLYRLLQNSSRWAIAKQTWLHCWCIEVLPVLHLTIVNVDIDKCWCINYPVAVVLTKFGSKAALSQFLVYSFIYPISNRP